MHSKNFSQHRLRPHLPHIHWEEDGENRSARWRSESGNPPPKRVVIADDQMTADAAYRLACEGTAMLWRGDFQNARQLLQALARRVDRKPRKAQERAKPPSRPRRRPPRRSICTARRSRSARARWRCC